MPPIVAAVVAVGAATRLAGLPYQAIVNALRDQGTPADGPTLAWLAANYSPGLPWMVLKNPTDRIQLDLRGSGSGKAYYDASNQQTLALSSGSDATFSHTWGSAATRPVVVLGSVTEFRAPDTTDGRCSFGGNVADLPSTLTYLSCLGSNTLTGDAANLPSTLTLLSCGGSNTLSGDVADLPTGLTLLYCGGSNTLSGDVADLPTGLTYLSCTGSNTLTGDAANLPTGLTFLYCWGSNTLSGDVADLPTGLTLLSCRGSNTLTITSPTLPNPLSYCRISRLTAQAEVDMVLDAMVAIIGQTKPRGDRYVRLDEDGGATPSAGGWSDYDTLVTGGYTVIVSGTHP